MPQTATLCPIPKARSATRGPPQRLSSSMRSLRFRTQRPDLEHLERCRRQLNATASALQSCQALAEQHPIATEWCDILLLHHFLIPLFCSDCVKYCCNTLLIGAVASAKSSHVHSRCFGDQVELHGADTAPVDIGGIGVDCARRNERIGGS